MPAIKIIAEPNTAEFQESMQQPGWHVIVLSFFSGCLYFIYWGYKTWRDLKAEALKHPEMETDAPLSVFKNVNPGLRAFGLLIPVINIYLMAVLVLGVANLLPDRNSFPKQHPMIACLLVVGAFLLILATSHLPGAWYLVSLLSVTPFAIVQHWINEYWATVENKDLIVRHAFSVREMIVIIVGASVIGLVWTGLMMHVTH